MQSEGPPAEVGMVEHEPPSAFSTKRHGLWVGSITTGRIGRISYEEPAERAVMVIWGSAETRGRGLSGGGGWETTELLTQPWFSALLQPPFPWEIRPAESEPSRRRLPRRAPPPWSHEDVNGLVVLTAWPRRPWFDDVRRVNVAMRAMVLRQHPDLRELAERYPPPDRYLRREWPSDDRANGAN